MKKLDSSKRKESERQKFIESIYHIVFMGNIVRNFESVLLSIGDKIDENEKMTVRYSVQWNVMITTISLLDELDKYLFQYKYSNFADKEVKEKIGSYKYIVEPILDSIKKWTDFRKFRNNVLAHNFRSKSEGFRSVHLTNKLHSYNAPESTMDLITLFKYVNSISKIAEEMFKSEYEEGKAIIDAFNNSPKRLSTPEEGRQKVNTSFLEVNKRINDYNEELKNLNR